MSDEGHDESVDGEATGARETEEAPSEPSARDDEGTTPENEVDTPEPGVVEEAAQPTGQASAPDATDHLASAGDREREVPEVVAEKAEGEPEPQPVAPVSEAAPPENELLTKMDDRLRQTQEAIVAQEERLNELKDAIGGVADQIKLIPPQVRKVGGKVESLTNSISDPKYNALLKAVLGIHDLVDQVLRSWPTAPEGAASGDLRRNYEVLRTQLRQLLEVNGLSEIPTDGRFDPNMHRALERVPCEDPAQADHVVKVVRPGFRTEQDSVLRYAEVCVGYHESPKEEKEIADSRGRIEPEAEAVEDREKSTGQTDPENSVEGNCEEASPSAEGRTQE